MQLNRLARIFGRFLASGFVDEGMASEKSQNHRINTGDFWWAWVGSNHRPHPYQDSVVRSYKNLQVPRGLPKTAQVLQAHSNCGFNCGLKIPKSGMSSTFVVSSFSASELLLTSFPLRLHRRYKVILIRLLSLQVDVEPVHDVMQPLYPMPRLS